LAGFIDVTPTLAGASIDSIDVVIRFIDYDERFVDLIECAADMREKVVDVSIAAIVVVE